MEPTVFTFDASQTINAYAPARVNSGTYNLHFKCGILSKLNVYVTMIIDDNLPPYLSDATFEDQGGI